MRLLLLFCLIPALSSAQSWNITAQGGGLWNSKSSKPFNTEYASPIRGMGAIALSYRTGPMEAGLSIGRRQYAWRIEADIIDLDPLTGQVIYAEHFKGLEKWPATAVAPFCKYHFIRKKLNYYAGIMPAYLIFDRASSTDTLTGHVSKYGSTAKGWGADVLAGVDYKLSSAIGVFAEGSGGVVNRQSFQERVWVYAASLQLGLRVSVGNKQSSKHQGQP